MEINSKKLDELYKEWSGEHHTTNINKAVHDSAECIDFAQYCLKWAVSEGEMIPKSDSKCNKHGVSNCDFSKKCANCNNLGVWVGSRIDEEDIHMCNVLGATTFVNDDACEYYVTAK